MNIGKVTVSTAIGCILFGLSTVASAQFLGTPARDNFRDTSILKPPAGSKVALIVFEDLGCPACAHAHPLEIEVAKQTHVPLLRYDFPLEAHIWTFQGAVYARYIQKAISPKLADEYRSAVFASQRSIYNKDDLQKFTQLWMQQHGKQLPFVLDADGSCAKEVRADYDLGRRLNVEYTPTVIVVTANNYQTVCGTRDGRNDPSEILPVVEAALEQTRPARPAH